VILAYQSGAVEKHAPIKVRLNGEIVETTVGRILFREIVPEGIPFQMINKELTKKK